MASATLRVRRTKGEAAGPGGFGGRNGDAGVNTDCFGGCCCAGASLGVDGTPDQSEAMARVRVSIQLARLGWGHKVLDKFGLSVFPVVMGRKQKNSNSWAFVAYGYRRQRDLQNETPSLGGDRDSSPIISRTYEYS